MIDFRVGDVRRLLADIPDKSIDLICTSPPFLRQRVYLPDDDPLAGLEIGLEDTPAEFIDVMLELSAEWGRILAPHGSLVVELGDKYATKGGTTDRRVRTGTAKDTVARPARGYGEGWPLDKSLCGIPHLYMLGLVWGRNLLTGTESPAGRWRARNYITWARPNPAPGELGDKFRPATSYITIACKGARRWFDLDAVRIQGPGGNPTRRSALHRGHPERNEYEDGDVLQVLDNPLGAPPLDWHSDMPDEDGDWLWKLVSASYPGSHYATFPLTLPERMIRAMCPIRVCKVCGKPSERILAPSDTYAEHLGESMLGEHHNEIGRHRNGKRREDGISNKHIVADYVTLGWTECGHDDWRTGMVLDPFVGSGTTLEAALNVGRHAIGMDLDRRNLELAKERLGPLFAALL